MTNADSALENLMAKAGRIEREVAAVRGHGEAADGRVRIQVDVTGAFVDFSVDYSLHGTDLDELTAAIITAHGAALAQAHQTAAELRTELHDDPYNAAIVHRLAAAGLREAAAAPEPADIPATVSHNSERDSGGPWPRVNRTSW